MTIRHVLALDNDDPICGDCATALGGKPHDAIVTVSARPCGHCHNIRECVAVRDYAWPATMTRPDDYSELESLLGRRG